MQNAEDDENEIESYKFEDAEGDDLTDWDNQEEVDTVPCPKCGKQVYEEAEQCHKCGHWINREDRTRFPTWVIVTAVICLVVVILVWVMGGW